jgi:hypothetical protein
VWVLEVRDRSGRRVHLTRERWAHILEHPEMAGALERIRETIERPQAVRESLRDPTVRYHFRHYKGAPARFLLVALKYLNGDGFVVSSFYTNKLV